MSFIVNSSKSPLTKEDYLKLRMSEKGLFKNQKNKQTNKQTKERSKESEMTP
jgi:hypothetical protein